MRKTLPLGVECANYINEEKSPVLEITGQQEKPVLAKAFSTPLERTGSTGPFCSSCAIPPPPPRVMCGRARRTRTQKHEVIKKKTGISSPLLAFWLGLLVF